MPGQTVNYQLPLPLEDEYYSVAVVNEVTERLDALLKEREEEDAAIRSELSAAQEQLGEAIEGGLTPLTARVTEAESKLTVLWDAVFTNITGNPFTVVLSSLDDITVTAGVWNAAKSRLEC